MDLLPSTDNQLVARIVNGDAKALEQLYDRYVRQCFGLALRMLGDVALAEEVVQEVFLKVRRRRPAAMGMKPRLFGPFHARSVSMNPGDRSYWHGGWP